MKHLLKNWREYLTEEIFGAQAILYHASREEPDKFLPYITGPASNFKSSGAGSIYGPGLYTVFDEKGVDFIGKAYGNFIYKFKVNLRGFIILDEAITQKVYKKRLLPSEQAQELGLSSKVVLALKELENEKPINNMAVAKLVQNEAKGLLISKGDTPQAVLYKPEVAVPMAWKKYKKTSWIPWKKGESSWNEIPPSIRKPNIKRSALDINEQRDQRPRKEPTPFKSKAQKRYKKKRKQNDIYSTVSGHKNLKSGAPFNTTPQRAGTDRLRFENTLLENIGRATRLSIFDFDETIAFTTGVINVINKETGETFQTKSQEEFDAIKDDDRYEFDFSPLDQVNDATENPNVTSIMRERLSDPDTQVMVLTARAPISIDDIHRTLRTFDKPIETSDIIMIGVEGQNKGNYLANVVLSKYDNIQEIEFYDDSQGNIDDMIQIKKELESIDRQIKFNIYLVKHGTPELVSG